MSGVYAFVNLITKQMYIGSSINISRRIAKHISQLDNKTHPNKKFENSWHKYGKDSFQFLVIEETNDLLNREQFYINLLGLDTLFNIAPVTSAPMKNRHHSEESRLKISNGNSGKIMSPEAKLAISLGNRGKRRTLEQKKLMSDRRSQKINSSDVLKMKELSISGVQTKEIAELFGLSRRYTRSILNSHRRVA